MTPAKLKTTIPVTTVRVPNAARQLVKVLAAKKGMSMEHAFTQAIGLWSLYQQHEIFREAADAAMKAIAQGEDAS